MTIEELVDQLREQLGGRIARTAPEVRNPYALAERLLPDALTFAMDQLTELLDARHNGTEEGTDVHWHYCAPLLNRRDELMDERDQMTVDQS